MRNTTHAQNRYQLDTSFDSNALIGLNSKQFGLARLGINNAFGILHNARCSDFLHKMCHCRQSNGLPSRASQIIHKFTNSLLLEPSESVTDTLRNIHFDDNDDTSTIAATATTTTRASRVVVVVVVVAAAAAVVLPLVVVVLLCI